MTKTCFSCKKALPLDLMYFYRNNSTSGFRKNCIKCTNIQNKTYTNLHKKEVAKYKDTWAKKNEEKCKKAANKYKNGVRLKVFQHYSKSKIPYCRCCDTNIFYFLTIDHINGDGSSHRKKSGLRGLTLYRYLRDNGFPAGYQVLCYNCNCSKGTGKMCLGHNKKLSK